jgi:hypothetical protein
MRRMIRFTWPERVRAERENGQNNVKKGALCPKCATVQLQTQLTAVFGGEWKMYHAVQANGTAGQKCPVIGEKWAVPGGTAGPTGPTRRVPVGAVLYRQVPLGVQAYSYKRRRRNLEECHSLTSVRSAATRNEPATLKTRLRASGRSGGSMGQPVGRPLYRAVVSDVASISGRP